MQAFVEPVVDRRIGGADQDGTVAQGPWAVLHASGEAPDDAALGQQIGDLFLDVLVRGIGPSLAVEDGFHLVVTPLGTEVHGLQEIGLEGRVLSAVQLGQSLQGRSGAQTPVSHVGVDVEILHLFQGDEALVELDIGEDAASHHDAGLSGGAHRVPAERHHHFFDELLGRGRDVFGFARAHEVVEKSGVPLQVAEIPGDLGSEKAALVALVLQDLAEGRAVDFRVSVRGQTCNLAFVAVLFEAQSEGDGTVEDAGGVVAIAGVEPLNGASAPQVDGGAQVIAHAVQGDDGGLLPGGGIVGTGRVRLVVFDKADGLAGRPGRQAPPPAEHQVAQGPAPAPGNEHSGIREGLGQIAAQPAAALRAVQAGHRHQIDLIEGRAGQVQHRGDGLVGKAAVVLYAAEALFIDRRDHFAVPDQGRAGVVHLGFVRIR